MCPMKKKFLTLLFVFCLWALPVRAQTAEVTISLNEQFFDALLDAIFKNTKPPEIPLSEIREKEKNRKGEEEKRRKGEEETAFSVFTNSNGNSFLAGQSQIPNPKSQIPNLPCPESIRLEREIDGTKTAVRFRDGRIFTPIAFTGNYNPPLIGCIDFSGVAETNIELEFDKARQTLIGRARVLSVNLSGAGGLGSGLLANMVQSSIDKKINPIQILQMDKVSFVVPIQNAGSLKMKAVGIKHEIGSGVLNVRIAYEFGKAP
jgi:hypothetical protein